ncbi:MAG TPA: YdhR family protein [Candidatus Krumholzibacteriaceae bacterium]|jgi:hypothetical protein|nr:YdhR family protein [Candidatus Krumholzibacteriaceae bacterium]
MKKIVQINFKFKTPPSKLKKHWLKHASIFGPNGKVKGLLWKIWLMNEAEKSAGGIYLFKDEASAQAYINGEIVAAVKTCPICSAYDAEIKVFDILPEHTKITRGPVE